MMGIAAVFIAMPSRYGRPVICRKLVYSRPTDRPPHMEMCNDVEDGPFETSYWPQLLARRSVIRSALVSSFMLLSYDCEKRCFMR
ncbi:hypothetical protein LOAG_09094 [Loa loa]|uniref:Uncharacterized protein n=1 Tax=Loa loa TaxID=7209 RepID=A0A1S0TTZ8_LOALO|nr:hypothetical protein LOAG_09094 [Loa loa]EFO19401.2 hypothetical protein LOAG_09094 [Loa loa]